MVFSALRHTLIVFTLLFSIATWAQPTFPYNGVLPKDVVTIAFTNARIYTDPSTVVDNGTLILEKGKVKAVGVGIAIPANAVVFDLTGKTIYPSFIDLYSDFGMPSASASPMGQGRRMESERQGDTKGVYGWNPAIQADYSAVENLVFSNDAASELRSVGIGVVLSHRMDGIARGTSAVVCLQPKVQKSVLNPIAAAHYSFNKGTSTMNYPSSLMGSVALLRQTYFDGIWYDQGGRNEERNLSLEAFQRNQKLPSIFDAGEKWNILRADEVGDEFKVQYIIKTAGNEYQRLADIKATQAKLIVPVNFPDAYDVSDPYLAQMVSLDEMKHWEMAPTNPASLFKEKIEFAFTSHGLNSRDAFLKNIRKAVQLGLPETEALKALTSIPATMVQMQNEIGGLKPGMWGNLLITSGNIFTEGTVIHENWVQGERFILEAIAGVDLKGKYELTAGTAKYDLEFREEGGKVKGEIVAYSTKKKEDGTVVPDTLKYSVQHSLLNRGIQFSFDAADNQLRGVVRLAGEIDSDGKTWKGRGELPNGDWVNWQAQLLSRPQTKAKEPKKDLNSEIGDMIYPFVAFGNTEMPKASNVLIKNATVWTCEQEGKLENADVLIVNGKVAGVGKNLSTAGISNLQTIDGTGKHVTPGIIDEHSHIALVGVNEGSQASSAEVQESRVVFPEDISIYRQLSGGVTCAQLLHGSANPIGGQSALIKLHWGGNAQDMLVDNAPGFIKFALGENVKQSNWYNDGSRFPQTRMGVEQLYYDHFIRAREYGQQWENYKKQSASVAKKGKKSAQVRTPQLAAPPRVDLEMQTLYEILKSERFVTCHSYVQSEINMLMHVADSMGFRLNTFTHILEGYKVADKMKEHGVGASSFSDWWAYKYEVKDAIPYNGALLWEQGITVAFNSDDDEMARRLNQEAAKAVKYGNVPETEALKFVTLNPAKLLHIDNRTGSLKVGKDADVVIWSASPLSIYAAVERTYVDGICYYDQQRDLEMRDWIVAERTRLIQKMLKSKAEGAPVQQPTFKDKSKFHCNSEWSIMGW